MRKIKVVYVTGSRAEYGLMKNNLLALKNNRDIELFLIISGMHLHPFFKSSLEEIKKNGFSIYSMVDTLPKSDTFEEVPVYIAKTILALQKLFTDIRQDFTIVLGDRPEMLSVAITSAFMSIPLIHLGGGHVSGNIDDSTRHAISKLSHIHLVSSNKCAERLMRMGEEKWRIHTCSASGVESIREYKDKLLNRQDILKKVGFNSNKELMVALYHPVDNKKDTKREISLLIDVIRSLKYQTLFIYSNLDPGGRYINRLLEDIKSPSIKVVENLEYVEYLSLLKHADVLIGNTSSGIIEAPSLKTAFINIGNRQNNREFAGNVIHVKEVTKKNIIDAINKSFSDSFQKQLRYCKNPYDNGSTAERLISIIKSTEINKKLLNKKNTMVV